MFTGKVREERKVTLGGKKRNADQKNNKEIVDEARKLREIRAIERLRLESSIKIQRVTRGFIIRKHFFSSLQSEFDSKVSYINKLEDVFKAKKAVFVVPNESLLSLANQLIWFSNYNESCVSYYTNSSSSLKGTKNNSNSYNTINNNDRRLIALQSLLTNSINSDQSKTNLLATITNDQLTNSPFANNNNFLRVVLKIFLLSARRFLFVLIDNSYENRHQMNISELIPSLHGLLQALSPINSTTTTLFETQKRFIGIVLMHDFFELVRKSSIALKLNKSVKTDDRIRSSISSIVKVAYGLVSDGIQFSLTSANTNVAIIDKVITGYRNVSMHFLASD